MSRFYVDTYGIWHRQFEEARDSRGHWARGSDTATTSHGRQVDVSTIKPELDTIHEFVSRHPDLFSSASVVGSFATQRGEHMPDRNGPKSSDIDLMLHENKDAKAPGAFMKGAVTSGGKGTHWGEVGQFEKDFQKKHGRRLQANIAPVLGSAEHFVVTGQER